MMWEKLYIRELSKFKLYTSSVHDPPWHDQGLVVTYYDRWYLFNISYKGYKTQGGISDINIDTDEYEAIQIIGVDNYV
jgi:hypothetical protein